MKTSISKIGITNNTQAVKDVLLEFEITIPETKINWHTLLGLFKGGPLNNAEGGKAWVEGNALHVDLPYLDLQLPKANQ